jgi:hypothetical protein
METIVADYDYHLVVAHPARCLHEKLPVANLLFGIITVPPLKNESLLEVIERNGYDIKDLLMPDFDFTESVFNKIFFKKTSGNRAYVLQNNLVVLKRKETTTVWVYPSKEDIFNPERKNVDDDIYFLVETEKGLVVEWWSIKWNSPLQITRKWMPVDEFWRNTTTKIKVLSKK